MQSDPSTRGSFTPLVVFALTVLLTGVVWWVDGPSGPRDDRTTPLARPIGLVEAIDSVDSTALDSFVELDLRPTDGRWEFQITATYLFEQGQATGEARPLFLVVDPAADVTDTVTGQPLAMMTRGDLAAARLPVPTPIDGVQTINVTGSFPAPNATQRVDGAEVLRHLTLYDVDTAPGRVQSLFEDRTVALAAPQGLIVRISGPPGTLLEARAGSAIAAGNTITYTALPTELSVPELGDVPLAYAESRPRRRQVLDLLQELWLVGLGYLIADLSELRAAISRTVSRSTGAGERG